MQKGSVDFEGRSKALEFGRILRGLHGLMAFVSSQKKSSAVWNAIEVQKKELWL